jgi:hypothetical protein
MLSPELLEVARRRVRVELEERARIFAPEVQRIRAEAVSRNAYHSTAIQQLLTKAVESELEVRASLAWQTLGRVLATQPSPVEPELGTQLKSFVAESLDAGCDDVRQVHEMASAIMPVSGVVGGWSPMRSFALEKVETEIDLSLLVIRQSQERGVQQPTINVYQPFGILQIGHGSSAVVLQDSASEERQRLREALEVVRIAVGETRELPESEAGDLKDVIAEAQSEIEKPSPNRIRLQGVLAGIAASVQTLGSAKDAYAVLKGAAALIGVHLP